MIVEDTPIEALPSFRTIRYPHDQNKIELIKGQSADEIAEELVKVWTSKLTGANDNSLKAVNGHANGAAPVPASAGSEGPVPDSAALSAPPATADKSATETAATVTANEETAANATMESALGDVTMTDAGA